MENWLRTDEAQEAVLALEMVKERPSKVAEEPYHWKWVILALHSSLQGFMVLALRGSDRLNALTNHSAKQWIEAYRIGDDQLQKPKLDTFLNLYEKIQSGQMMIYGISKVFMPTGTQTDSVRRLNRLRNDFTHFLPKGWSLEVSGLPRVVNDCLAIISFLALESRNILWHEEAFEAKTKALIEQIQQEIGALTEAYDG